MDVVPNWLARDLLEVRQHLLLHEKLEDTRVILIPPDENLHITWTVNDGAALVAINKTKKRPALGPVKGQRRQLQLAPTSAMDRNVSTTT